MENEVLIPMTKYGAIIPLLTALVTSGCGSSSGGFLPTAPSDLSDSPADRLTIVETANGTHSGAVQTAPGEIADSETETGPGTEDMMTDQQFSRVLRFTYDPAVMDDGENMNNTAGVVSEEMMTDRQLSRVLRFVYNNAVRDTSRRSSFDIHPIVGGGAQIMGTMNKPGATRKDITFHQVIDMLPGGIDFKSPGALRAALARTTPFTARIVVDGVPGSITVRRDKSPITGTIHARLLKPH